MVGSGANPSLYHAWNLEDILVFRPFRQCSRNWHHVFVPCSGCHIETATRCLFQWLSMTAGMRRVVDIQP